MAFYLTSYTKNVVHNNVNNVISSKKQRKAFKKGSGKVPDLSEEEIDKKNQYARKRYRNLSEEEMEKHYHYDRERYKKFLEDKKQRLVEYINNFV